MSTYVATFFTHFDAVRFAKTLRTAGHSAQPMPVPRRLSSSCGTCVRFSAESDPLAFCGETVELLALVSGEDYVTVWDNRA